MAPRGVSCYFLKRTTKRRLADCIFPVQGVTSPIMGLKKPPTTMREVLDRLDVVREELHTLQVALERLAIREGTPGSNVVPNGSDVGP
jgi:hypothetical protein